MPENFSADFIFESKKFQKAISLKRTSKIYKFVLVMMRKVFFFSLGTY
jgi:hypothetical protein